MNYLIAALLFLASAPAFAQSVDFERDVLRSIDTVPTRAQLDATYRHARARLEAAALNDNQEMWIRDRAITLLSFYPDPRSRGFLESLLEHHDPHVRRMAVYTLGRTFGEQADLDLVAKLVEVIKQDDSDEVVKWAIRSLRWVHHDQATHLLEDLARRDDTKGRIAALALKRSTYQSTSAR